MTAPDAERPELLRHGGEAAEALHDTVLQTLFAIGGHAASAGRDESVPAETREALRTIADLASAAARDLRAALGPLRADPVAKDGLGPALERLVEAVRRRSSLTIELSVAPELAELRDDVASVLYRVCREGLAIAQRLGALAVCRIESDGQGEWATASIAVVSGEEAESPAQLWLADLCGALGGKLTLPHDIGAERGVVLAGRLPLSANRP